MRRSASALLTQGEAEAIDQRARNPFLRDNGAAQVALKGTRDPNKA
jgi:hypothetical protein